MKDGEREDLLKSLNQTMTRRMQTRRTLNDTLREFCERLFAGMEAVLETMQTSGIPGIGKYRRLTHPGARGHEAFQVFIEDWSIIFVPMSGFARPNLDDEALIEQYLFKQACGRIGVFLTDEPQGAAFYDFLIFEDRSWFAWGYGWPRQQADIQETDFEALALELINSFVKDIFVTWHTREETLLSQALDSKKHSYEFGLPGEEQHGGR